MSGKRSEGGGAFVDPAAVDNNEAVSNRRRRILQDQRKQKYQFCSSFLHSNRLCTWLLGFALLVGGTWTTLQEAGAPGGPIFSLLILYSSSVLCGWLFDSVFNLPPLLGMLFSGLALRNVPVLNILVGGGGGDVDDNTRRGVPQEWSSTLRMLALTVLLLLAGMGMDPRAIRRHKLSIILLGIVPFMVEAAAHAVLSHFILGFSWVWGILLGFALAGAAAAIVVPGMLSLQRQKLGNSAIPSVAIAASAFDDILAIAGVTLAMEYIFVTSRQSSLAWKILVGPMEIALGVAYGVMAGLLLWIIPSRSDPYVEEFRAAFLFGLGVLAVFGSQSLYLEGAGALAALVTAFVAGIGWRRQERRPAAGPDDRDDDDDDEDASIVSSLSSMFDTAPLLTTAWTAVFQPLLFGLIGAAVAFDTNVEWSVVWRGLIILLIAIALRSAATVGVLGTTDFTWHEKWFVCIAWWAKAGLQAAVGPLAYDEARRTHAAPQTVYIAQQVLTLAVLSIVVTAPLSAVNLTWGASRFLQRRAPAAAAAPRERTASTGTRDSRAPASEHNFA